MTPLREQGLPGSIRGQLCSAAFVILFISFTALDVFVPWLAETSPGSGLSRLAEWGSLALSAALFAYMLLRWLPAQHESAVPKLGDSLRFDRRIGDPLLVLRLFAFGCVWMTHSALLLKPLANVWDGAHFLLRGCAHQGMAVFFTLSGYLMGKAFARGRYAVNRKGLTSFYLNRALRIAPLYLFAQVTVMLLVRPELLTLATWPSLLRLVTFTYYSSPLQAGPIGALWSLSTEMQYYLLAPFLYVLLAPALKSGRATALGLLSTAVLGTLLRVLLFHAGGYWQVHGNPPLYNAGSDWQVHRYTPLYINLDLFITGLWFNGFVELVSKSKEGRVHFGFWFLGGFALMLAFYVGACAFTGIPFFNFGPSGQMSAAGPGTLAYEYAPSVVALITGAIVLCLEMGGWAYTQLHSTTRDMRPVLAFRWLQGLGICTYGFYVWHPAILEAANKVLTPADSTGAYVQRSLVCLLEVFALAAVTYFLVEKPFADRKVFKS
jgi:peptidoglycan/LPS O-acetylase OafA/YrhL